MKRYIQDFIENNDFQKVLIYGFYLTFIAVNAMALIIDSLNDNYTSAVIELITIIFAGIIFWRTHTTQKLTFGAYGVWIGPIAVYALIIFSGFAYWNFYFTILIPLAFYTLFPFRLSFMQTGIHFLIVTILMIIGYFVTYDNFLHNIDSLSAFVISMIFMTAFGVFYHANMENSYNKLYKSNLQKEILLKEVHHRVKNNLNVLGSIFGLQAMRETSRTKDILLHNKLKIESMSMVHEMLYRHDDFSDIDFYTYSKTLAINILELFEKNDVDINIKSCDVSLPLDIMLKIGLILNEMITNTLKYCINDIKLSIYILCERVNHECILKYHDNGQKYLDVGSINDSKGIGMKLIRLTTKELSGNLEVYYDSGLHYELTFHGGLKNA
jgi:two-component sensor histidine kinase